MNKCITFFRKETVLCISVILAMVSAAFVHPDTAYISYIDFRTLAILFCLMTIVASFRELGLFDAMAGKLLQQVQSRTGIILILVLLCFFLSMFITNDVALITFVPFAITILHRADPSCRNKWIITCVAMQTIAANLGSMLTPIGNPQNLFLYGKFGGNLHDFIRILLPYSILSLILLVGWVILTGFLWKKDPDMTISVENSTESFLRSRFQPERFISYLILFIISLLAVAHKIHFAVPFVLVLFYSLLRNRKILLQVDYSLLLTFVGLFIFIGNLGRIPSFSSALQRWMNGKETITAILASQVMSNVPAAILLEKFTSDIPALIIGTNLGGLGTLIASMASLISFKYISNEEGCKKGQYFSVFTLSNVLFLLVLLSIPV